MTTTKSDPALSAPRKCYCESDCNCRYVGDPIFGHRGRMASCGCQCQSDKNKAR